MTETLVAVKEVVVAVAAAAAAVAAWWGVSTWRRQLKGKAEYDVALKVLRATYRVRDAIQAMRSPFMSGGEMQSAMASEGFRQPPPLATASTQAFHVSGLEAGYSVRWGVVSEALADLSVARLEAEAIWGEDAARCLDAVRQCARDLNAATRMYLKRQRNPRGAASEETFERELEETVFSTGAESGDDAFTMRLREAVASMEAFIRPKLK